MGKTSLIKESSHMIFSPLSHLQALLFLIRKDFNSSEPKDLLARVENAQKTLTTLSHRISSVIAYATLSKEDVGEKKDYSLSDIVRTAIEIINNESAREKILFQNGKDYHVHANREELLQGLSFLGDSLPETQSPWIIHLSSQNLLTIKKPDSVVIHEVNDKDLKQYYKVCTEIAQNVLRKYGITYEIIL